MKKTLLAIFLLASTVACFASDKPNPAEYTITIHVQSSRLVDLCGPRCIWVEHMNVLVDGKKYELSDTTPRTDLFAGG